MKVQSKSPIHPVSLSDAMDEYINLPRIVRAIQITPEFAAKCFSGEIKLPDDLRIYQFAKIEEQVKDFVMEFNLRPEKGGKGKLYASFNDWIVKGTAGEWYPVNDEIFNYKYARHEFLNASEAPYNG